VQAIEVLLSYVSACTFESFTICKNFRRNVRYVIKITAFCIKMSLVGGRDSIFITLWMWLGITPEVDIARETIVTLLSFHIRVIRVSSFKSVYLYSTGPAWWVWCWLPGHVYAYNRFVYYSFACSSDMLDSFWWTAAYSAASAGVYITRLFVIFFW
jgi:hypothetical protein